MPPRSSCTRAWASCAAAFCAPPASSSAGGWTASICSCPSGRATALSRKYDFSLHLSSSHQLQGIDCLVEGEGLRDVGFELARPVPCAELRDAGGELLRL